MLFLLYFYWCRNWEFAFFFFWWFRMYVLRFKGSGFGFNCCGGSYFVFLNSCRVFVFCVFKCFSCAYWGFFILILECAGLVVGFEEVYLFFRDEFLYFRVNWLCVILGLLFLMVFFERYVRSGKYGVVRGV